MDHLPENQQQSVRLGREKPLGAKGQGQGQGQHPLMIVLPPSFLEPTFHSKVGRYLAGDRAGLLKFNINSSCLTPVFPIMYR